MHETPSFVRSWTVLLGLDACREDGDEKFVWALGPCDLIELVHALLSDRKVFEHEHDFVDPSIQTHIDVHTGGDLEGFVKPPAMGEKNS